MSDKANQGGLASAERFSERLKRLDETRWIATRYAERRRRRVLVALYLFNIELKRAAQVGEPMIASIRLQWWREALAEPVEAHVARRQEILSELAEALPVGPSGLLPLTRLVDAWQERVDRPGSQLSVQENTLLALAMSYLLPGADEAHIASLAAEISATKREQLRKLVRKLDDRLKPAIVHLAATDGEGQRTSGVRARWQILSTMLLGAF